MTGEELEKKKKGTFTRCLNEFIHDYCDLADNPRYADNYHYKLGEYYMLLDDKKKAYECWDKIKDKEKYADLIKKR